MGLVFAAARHIATMHEIMRDGGWQVMQGMELKGKTLGLVGLGGIGREMARLGKGIGLEVIAYNRIAGEGRTGADGGDRRAAGAIGHRQPAPRRSTTARADSSTGRGSASSSRAPSS